MISIGIPTPTKYQLRSPQIFPVIDNDYGKDDLVKQGFIEKPYIDPDTGEEYEGIELPADMIISLDNYEASRRTSWAWCCISLYRGDNKHIPQLKRRSGFRIKTGVRVEIDAEKF